MTDLTNDCFAYLQHHSYRFFTDNFAGALVKRVNRFAASFEVIADQCSFTTGQTAIRLILVVGVIFWRNRILGYVFLTWTLIFVGFNLAFSKWKLKYDLARAEMDTKVTARLADTIANASNLKLFAGIGREIRAFQGITDEHQRTRYKSWMLGLYSDSIQAFSVRALQIVVLILAVRFWLKGTLTLGDFVLLRSYLDQITFNVTQLGTDIRKIYEAMADANEMTEILLTPHEVVDCKEATELHVSRGVVEFRHVRFTYPGGGKPVLDNFYLKTEAGERVGVVGPSGGGKSTILKALVRLHDLESGAILIDGQNTAQVTQSSLHRNIAFVPQEPILFHRTLMENIRYSRPAASDEEVIEAAKLAHCDEFISAFPERYRTLVGERGIKLSGGERQRVAIARAILMDAPILVLDEATSSLDSESEMFIQDSLSRLVIGRTVIAVAHRLSTIHKMDRIVVVKDGQIIEQGSHDLLVKIDDGVYRELWNLQSTGFSPAAHATA
jgi:ATP-binding cassette subfamily B protein